MVVSKARHFALATLWGLATLISGQAVAQTDHATTCSGTFAAAGNPHRITTPICTVPVGETLTVEAGAIVEASIGIRTLRVSGTVNATNATFTNVNFEYFAGSTGTVSGCEVVGTFDIRGNTVDDPATPQILNNTIQSTQSPIFDVFEAATPTIQGNTISTNGFGIRFRGDSGGSATGNTVDFQSGQGQSRVAFHITERTSVVFNDNTAEDDPLRSDFPLDTRLLAASSTAQITNNDICATGADVPIRFGRELFGNSQATVQGNTLTCEDGAGVQIDAGSLPQDATIEPIDGFTSFFMPGNLSAAASGTTTIATGITLTGNRSFQVNGVLNADGLTLNGNLDYFDGGSGTVQNSTITAVSQPIRIGGAQALNPATPTITNNTITATSGGSTGIVVRQFGAPTISNNTITYEGTGVFYQNNSGGSASGNTLNPGPAVGISRAFRVDNASAPTITANTLNNDPGNIDIGFELRSNENSTTTFRNNTICSTNSDVPLALGPAAFLDGTDVIVSDNDFVCDDDLPLQLVNVSVIQTGTIAPVNGIGVFGLETTLSLNNGADLTIAPGVEINSPFTTLINSGATLRTDGSVFRQTLLDFRAGAAGVIENSMFIGARMSIAGASPTIRNNLFTGTNGRTQVAITVGPSAGPTIDANTFEGYNIAIQINDGSSNTIAGGNTFTSTNHAVQFQNASGLFNAFPASFETNSFDGPVHDNTVRLPFNIDTGGTIRSIPTAYRALSMTILAGVTVFIDPGVAILNDSNTTITANGRLVAVGDPDRRIIFTATRPELNTRWRQLIIRNQAAEQASVLENCVFEFGGLGGATILFDNAEADVSDVTIFGSLQSGILFQNDSRGSVTGSAIFNNAQHGIRIRDISNPTLNFNSIFANSLNAINHESCSSPAALFGLNDNQFIDATNNYFGSDSGPFDNSDDRNSGGLFNPTGTGGQVTDCVDYSPFLTLAPDIEGNVTIVGGAGQTGMTGTTLPAPLVVEVRNLANAPLAGIEVLFSVIAGDANIATEQPILTAANGRAAASVQLGAIPGPITIAATAKDVDSPAAVFMPISDSGALTFALESLAPQDWLCPGDCDGAFDVSIDELVTGVDIALSGNVARCAALDRDSDNRVSVAELVLAVKMALQGCPES